LLYFTFSVENKAFLKSPIVATLIGQIIAFALWQVDLDRKVRAHEAWIQRFSALANEEKIPQRVARLEERLRLSEEEINELEVWRDGRLQQSN
jgi:hypothetical protein